MIKAHNIITAKRKLSLILSSQSPTDVHLSGGELIEIYIKQRIQK